VRSIYDLIRFFLYFLAANKSLFTHIPISKLLTRLLASHYSSGFHSIRTASYGTYIVLSSSSRAALFSWYWCSVQLQYEDEAASSIERDIPHVAELWCGIYCIIFKVTLVFSLMKKLVISCSFAGLPASIFCN
jgi:hypothetical protein